MKKSLLLYALSAFTLPAFPQKWSAGIRTGTEQLNTNLDEHDFKSWNLQWHNQVFVGRQLGKNTEVEAALGYSDYSISSTYEDWGGNGTVYFQESRDRSVTLFLSGKYYFFRTKQLGLFFQAGITFLKSLNTYNSTVYKPQSAPMIMEEKNNLHSIADRLYPGFGFQYNAAPRLFFTGQFNVYYKTNAITSMTNNANDWASGLYLGAGYRF